MKTLFILLISILLVACKNTIGDVSIPEDLAFSWHTIVLLIAGIYEVVVRAIPSVGNYSIIAKIIDLMLWISEFFNRKKK